MLEFPRDVDAAEPPHAKMTLRQYTVFCQQCLLGNAAVTADNCLHKRPDESEIRVPFTLHEPLKG